MARTLADFFDGKTNDESYVQPLSKDGLGRWSGLFRTQTFSFTGVPLSMLNEAGTTGHESVSVTDLDGKTYTVPLVSKDEDSSTGSAWFSKEKVVVAKPRMSYHMGILTVTRTGGELRQNGRVFASGPNWMYE